MPAPPLPTSCRKRRFLPPREPACARFRHGRSAATSTSRQLVAGSRITLPVHVEGALVSVGDLHFAQGDGEVCGTGIEVAGAVDAPVSASESTTRASGCRSFETPERPARRSFATTGIALDTPMDIDAAARVALLEMIDYLEADSASTRAAAYALCSVAVDLRISEVVDVPYPLVSALLPLDIFEP